MPRRRLPLAHSEVWPKIRSGVVHYDVRRWARRCQSHSKRLALPDAACGTRVSVRGGSSVTQVNNMSLVPSICVQYCTDTQAAIQYPRVAFERHGVTSQQAFQSGTFD